MRCSRHRKQVQALIATSRSLHQLYAGFLMQSPAHRAKAKSQDCIACTEQRTTPKNAGEHNAPRAWLRAPANSGTIVLQRYQGWQYALAVLLMMQGLLSIAQL
jgi:predicted aminopeptidase